MGKVSLPSIVAIDGPVAVGKSTVGKLVAQKLGYDFIDTGMMYRALTWLALKLGLDIEDEAALSKLAAETRIEDVTGDLHHPEVEAKVSEVSKVAGVREALVAQQRRMAEKGKVVMAGRDIGTVVLPQAELKIFLGASPEERARRRYREKAERGEANYEDILAELKRRDEIDSQRAISPLRPDPEARIIDTEFLSPEQVVAQIFDIIEKG